MRYHKFPDHTQMKFYRANIDMIRIELEYSISTSQSLYGQMRIEAIYNSKPEFNGDYKEIKFDKCPSEIQSFINRVRYDEIWICRYDNPETRLYFQTLTFLIKIKNEN